MKSTLQPLGEDDDDLSLHSGLSLDSSQRGLEEENGSAAAAAAAAAAAMDKAVVILGDESTTLPLGVGKPQVLSKVTIHSSTRIRSAVNRDHSLYHFIHCVHAYILLESELGMLEVSNGSAHASCVASDGCKFKCCA